MKQLIINGLRGSVENYTVYSSTIWARNFDFWQGKETNILQTVLGPLRIDLISITKPEMQKNRPERIAS